MIGVLNPFLATLGGGERSTLEFARALRDILAEPVVIYSVRSKATNLRFLEAAFGRELRGISIQTAATMEALPALVRSRRHTTFVNHWHHSQMPNPARFGIYAMMFPKICDGTFLETYDAVLCNSAFTAQYTLLHHPQVRSTVDVVPPPIAPRGALRAEKDWRSIVNVGRFSSDGHCKRQKELAAVVSSCNRRLRAPLRLVCCGRADVTPYYEECLALADDNVRFERDVDERSLGELINRAGIYLHGTGLGHDFGDEPQVCEHLGLSIVEAMATGAIPVVYGRGGAVEFVDHGVNGFLYNSMHELEEILVSLEHMSDGAKRAIGERARARAEHFSYERFVASLRAVVKRSMETASDKLPRRPSMAMDQNNMIVASRMVAEAERPHGGCTTCMDGLIPTLQAAKVQSLAQNLEAQKAAYAVALQRLSAENSALAARLSDMTAKAARLEDEVRATTPSKTAEKEITGGPGHVTQVFFDLGKGFNELDSVSLPFRYEPGPVRYELAFPAEALARALRIDLGAREGMILVDELCLRDGSGAVLWRERGAALRGACSVGGTAEYVPQDEQFGVLSYGEDPYVLLGARVSCATPMVKLTIVVRYERSVDLRALVFSLRGAAASTKPALQG